ncbi:hypothetical protein SUDANB58_05532 [Streptomyces sp. enrichment culture]
MTSGTEGAHREAGRPVTPPVDAPAEAGGHAGGARPWSRGPGAPLLPVPAGLPGASSRVRRRPHADRPSPVAGALWRGVAEVPPDPAGTVRRRTARRPAVTRPGGIPRALTGTSARTRRFPTAGAAPPAPHRAARGRPGARADLPRPPLPGLVDTGTWSG